MLKFTAHRTLAVRGGFKSFACILPPVTNKWHFRHQNSLQNTTLTSTFCYKILVKHCKSMLLWSHIARQIYLPHFQISKFITFLWLKTVKGICNKGLEWLTSDHPKMSFICNRTEYIHQTCKIVQTFSASHIFQVFNCSSARNNMSTMNR